jgi:hypothetical protein
MALHRDRGHQCRDYELEIGHIILLRAANLQVAAVDWSMEWL